MIKQHGATNKAQVLRLVLKTMTFYYIFKVKNDIEVLIIITYSIL
jgi:hypothetical protein